MTQVSTAKRSYPWATKLKDKQVAFRLMEAKDREAILTFAKSLPTDDLLFLSVDITEKDAVRVWTEDIENGRIVTVLAEIDGKIVGHGTIIQNALTWTRHIGEIQLLLSPETRGLGLGGVLASEVFALAKERGVQKIVARMAFEQRGAKAVFEKLGFNAEALLADFVIDRHGKTHDLIVMTYDVTGFTE